MSFNYLKKAVSVGNPPQSQPLDSRQVQNSAGGFVYAVDDWKRLERFLILGSEGGTYYASEQDITKANIECVKRCVAANGTKTVAFIEGVSIEGRAPKNDPALLALAYAASKGDPKTRAAAFAALPVIARTGTHLFHFMAFVKKFRGTGRGLRTAIKNWYKEKTPQKFAEQVVKYQQRDGWAHRDLLRLVHPKLRGAHNQIARWVVNGTEPKDGKVLNKKVLPEVLQGHILIQKADSAEKAAKLIRKYGLVRESVPTELLKSPVVWEALLEDMPLTAMIRNLGNMSKIGLLKPLSDASKYVVSKLGNAEVLRKSRVHPIQILIAAKTYASGHGLRGHGEWIPVAQVIDALDTAFYDAFKNVEPTGKNFYLGLDISGSMWGGNVAGIPDFTPAIASAAMAMVTVKTEKNYYAAGFTSSGGGSWYTRSGTAMTPIALSPKQRLDDVLKTTNALSARMGGTDCALPMIDALSKGLIVNTFVIYTDNETWAGNVHPMVALQNYRNKTGINAKLIVCGMTATQFTIADPADAGTLDVVGFDTNTPSIISDFARE